MRSVPQSLASAVNETPAAHPYPAPAPRQQSQAPTPGVPDRTGPAGAVRELPGIPAHAFPHRTPLELLAVARRGLAEAEEQHVDGLRYAAAHLAALRAAAAVLAMRARPAPARRSRPASVWTLLAVVAPELGEWAAYFASGAAKRAAAEAGIRHVVSTREADDLLRGALAFVAVVERTLGLPSASFDQLVA